MSGQEYRLKATKTGLYELVKRHFGAPVKRRQVEFAKCPGSRAYSLDFVHDGRAYQFLFTACGGKAILGRDMAELYGAHDWSWDTVDIEPSELMELGLAEPTAKKNTA